MTNYISDEDEDLKRAIALSLQDANYADAEPSHAARTSNNSSETEDEVTPGQTSASITTLAKEITPPRAVQEILPITSTMLGLDRKKMEEERLARLAKRKRTVSQDMSETLSMHSAQPKRAKASPDMNLESVSLPSQTKNDRNGSRSDEAVRTMKYPKGAILRTYARHHARQRDITIEEVLQKDHLNVAIISAYTFNLSWLFKKLDTARTKLILCMGAKSEGERQQMSAEALQVGRGSIKLIFPPMEGEASIMHSKLMLLRYDHSLRIVVTSANAEMYDWGETGVMENSVFVIDLPELADGSIQVRDELPNFGKDLLYFLDRSNFDSKITDGLLKFDFSGTKDVGFVHSIGGANFGADMQRTGFNSLARCVNQLDLKPAPGSKFHVTYITASLGALSNSQLKSVIDASLGKINTSTPTRQTKASSPISTAVRKAFSVIFPTNTTVEHSTGGPDNAGTICLSKKSYEQSTFPHDILQDYTSTRRGMLSHAKIILAYTTGAQKPHRNKAWVFVGSHNFTESAWGKVVKDRAQNEMKIVCRNWECGVMLPVPVNHDGDIATDKIRELFAPVFDIPCDFPGRPYIDEDEPWFFMDRRRWT